MKKDQLIHIGTFGQPKGLNGEIKINILTSSLDSFREFNQYFCGDRISKVEFISFRNIGKKIIVSVKDCNDRNQAIKFNGKKVFTLRKNFPSINKNEYYAADLLECKVFDKNKKNFGNVFNVKNFGASDLLEIKHKKKFFLVPVNSDNIIEINIEKKIIIIDPIKGLFE